MNSKRVELSRLYHAALHQYLEHASGSSMEPARELGRQAVDASLETLDMARIHEIALASLFLRDASPDIKRGILSRAGLFFAEAITPIEQTHRGAREANIHLNQAVKALSQRTLELADSVEDLKLEIAQRKTVEKALQTSEMTSSNLLVESLQMQEELRLLSRQLLSAQEEERRKISRELHDVIAQTLTSINLRLAELNTESETSRTKLQQKIESTQRLVEESVEIVHRFARELRPTVLDDLGLIPALESFLKSFMEDTGVRVSLKAFAGIEKSDSNVRTVLYRIAQEALTNVARHAAASRAEVSIRNLKGTIRMEIIDNGKGFEVEGTSCAKQSNRLGLLGMRERIEMIGGTFCVDSALGRHTTIRVEVPSNNHPATNVKKSKPLKTTTLKCP